MVKVIGFDCGGVLLADSWSPDEISEEFGVPHGALWDRTQENLKPLGRGEISVDDFLTRVLKDYGLPMEKVKKMVRRRMHVMFPENFELIRNLKGSYELVLMNNEGLEWNRYRVRKFKLDKLFDHIYSSCDLGVAKPDEEYYREVLRRLGVEPRDLVFIDNMERNIKSARKQGINSILFESPSQLRQKLIRLGVKLDS